MNSYNKGKLRNAISFKGPSFYFNYVPQFLESTSLQHPCMATHNLFKNHTKSFVLNIQSNGSPSEWEGTNSPLYNVPGMPRVERENIPKVSYVEIP